MNRNELVDSISEMTSLPKKDSNIVLCAVIDAIKNGLIADGKVSITGFGNFLLVEKPERMARNPRTGEKIMVAAKKTLKFKPATEMKTIKE